MKSFKQVIIAITISVLFVNCTESTEDLYRAETPDIEAQTEENQLENRDREDTVSSGPAVEDFSDVADAPESTVVGLRKMVDIDPTKVTDVEQVISLQSEENRPALDLLFVIDNSKSMDDHQIRLKNNIDNFVAALSKTGLLDYRIGVTTTYDSRRYFKRAEIDTKEYDNQISEWKRVALNPGENPRNFERLGKLMPLKSGSNGENLVSQGLRAEQLDDQGRVNRYIMPGMSADILAETLKVGYKNFKKYDEYVAVPPSVAKNEIEKLKGRIVEEAASPRFEELLSPMVAALNLEGLLSDSNSSYYRGHYPQTNEKEIEFPWDPPKAQEPSAEANKKWQSFARNFNQGFVREKAHLGVIFVTDTIDQSPYLDAELAASYLRDLKKSDNFSKISTYGVIHKKSITFDLQKSANFSKEWSGGGSCNSIADEDIKNRNGFNKPEKLEAFLNLTRGNKKKGANIFNLCSSRYGENLVAVAEDLFVNSVSKGSYDLEMIPTDEFQVYLNNSEKTPVPVCQAQRDDRLCWKIRISTGERKILLFNQQKLAKGEVVVKYKGLDPTSATNLNSK